MRQKTTSKNVDSLVKFNYSIAFCLFRMCVSEELAELSSSPIDEGCPSRPVNKFVFSTRPPKSGSRSRKAPMEKIFRPEDLTELEAFGDWRSPLDPFWTATDPADYLEWNGKTYRSHIHALQAAKYRKWHSELADQFCVESGNNVGVVLDAWEVLRLCREQPLTKGRMEYWRNHRKAVREEILEAKFTASSLPGRILIATREAELWSSPCPEAPWRRNVFLEKLRTKLQTSAKNL